ncbi:hypothetical protein A3C28_05900 [Candidatus Roizmanbacteria bacterium RIFCSPHIGHO2_02_FULL_39_9]|uniref:Uncharacterized protein n=2 Tax=Candidatus Roizmaniibacteriota TaxID=1752723 RepID=A0A1F7HU39_9BACT|nr:MAG: hypothetical protein A3C28_05900 [Candidatus Roizmanbacteria bacterium RIFCSPHIGHO2_02_FULL_39_9]OGK34625.1 MAG: hypothetical protein A3F60_01660 [Candidatus Roizmanbacteria bacterium RIFCSPHIGHO2_12_FULL_39_8]
MEKPNFMIMAGYGLNCEEETKYAFELAGGSGDIVHINDLIAGIKKLNDYQILAIPGGFAYGDDTGAGNAFANKMKNHLLEKLKKFIAQDRLVIGICNGFQILAHLELLPVKIALINNNTARYTDRWVDCKVENSSPWLRGIKTISMPIAHGEGNVYVDAKTLDVIKKKTLVALRYTKGAVCEYQSLPANPNGSIDNIAGISDESGKIFGLMPHPERAMFFTQLPNWPYLREKYKRSGEIIPDKGPGLRIFKNAIDYFN